MSTRFGSSAGNYFSLEEYFKLELESPIRHEYWYGEIVCMSGGTDEHGAISSNIHGELYARLKGSNCQARTENTAVKNPLPPRLDWPLLVYPDASVVCEPRRIETVRGIDTLVNPVLVVEVLSPTTQHLDTGDKFTIYTAIPSLKDYLIVASEIVFVTHWQRDGDGNWSDTSHRTLDDSVVIESLNLKLGLREIYRGVFS